MSGGLTLGLDWEALGAQASGAIDGVHSVLVTGSDPVASARAAIGLGRVQSRSRRVAIGDLVGDVQPLQSLVTSDDPHGIVDSFLYGVSLNKIARQVDDAGMLFIMPSGTEPTISAEIMGNERWQRLAAGFREVGALLVLVAPSDAPGVKELASLVDGVVVVGDPSAVFAIPRHTVLAHIDAPPVRQAEPVLEAPVAPPVARVVGERRPSLAPPPLMLPKHETDEQRPIAPKSPRTFPKTALIAGGLTGVLAAAAALWFGLGRPGLPGTTASNAPQQAEAPTSRPTPDLRVLGVEGDSVVPQVPAPDTVNRAVVANPQDSLLASAYGVVIVATNDEAKALASWAELGLTLPAGTVTMERVRGERGRSFLMQAGAFTKAKDADSLLASLRRTGKLQADAGRVIKAPYALLIETKVSRPAAKAVANGYGQRQIPAYALLQTDGTASIFVGAFESPEQAIPLMAELVAKGTNTTLYIRTGRSF